MTRHRIAVIGLGAISQSVHLPLLRRNAARFEITALVDLSATRVAQLAAAYGVGAGYSSVDALVDDVSAGRVAVDGAIIATSGSHAADTMTLVAAGIKVLAEKPLAFAQRELHELRDFANGRGIDLRDWVRVGYMKEYDRASVEAAALLADVTLRAITVEVLHPVDGAQLEFARLAPPTDDVPQETLAPLLAATDRVVDEAVGADIPADMRTLYTNVVLGSVVHDIALLRRLVGGIGETRHAEHWGTAMPGSLHLRGTLAQQPVPWSIDWHYIVDYPDYRETVTFHHETGSIELVFGVPYVVNLPTVLRVTDRRPGLGARVSESRWMQQEAFENELTALADLIDGGRPDGSGVDEALADTKVGQGMIRALAAAGGHSVSGEAATDPE